MADAQVAIGSDGRKRYDRLGENGLRDERHGGAARLSAGWRAGHDRGAEQRQNDDGRYQIDEAEIEDERVADRRSELLRTTDGGDEEYVADSDGHRQDDDDGELDGVMSDRFAALRRR